MMPLLLAYVENNSTDVSHMEGVLAKHVVNPVKVFPSGEDLMAFLADHQHNPPGVIMIDFHLAFPGMDGLDTIRAIRRSFPEMKDTPIVVLTGQDIDRELKGRIKRAGGDGLVQKPFTLDTLYSLLGLPGWYRLAVISGARA